MVTACYLFSLSARSKLIRTRGIYISTAPLPLLLLLILLSPPHPSSSSLPTTTATHESVTQQEQQAAAESEYKLASHYTELG